jgi:N-acetyl-gamma-glutamyl-phosphate reductase
MPFAQFDSDGRLGATAVNGTNRVELFVSGKPEQILVTARLDNLGKGAAGAAVQNLNLMLGLPELTGLTV